jgi:hypothetical protein
VNIIHPAVTVLEETMLAWTGDKAQAAAQARLCAIALVHAGLLPDAEIVSGVVVRQEAGKAQGFLEEGLKHMRREDVEDE